MLGGLPASGIPNEKVLLWFKLASYNLDIQFFSILRDTVIIYDQGTTARFQQTINRYDYNRKNFQLKRKVTSENSKNEVITQNFTYPPDYTVLSTNNTTGRSIYNLQNKAIISVPIVQYFTKIKNGVEYVVNGKLNVYKNDLPVIDAVYNLETNGITPMSNFQTSGIDGNNNFIFHAAYVRRLIQSRYTDKGMIAEVYKQDDSKQAYIWDYKGLKLIAEVKNADILSVAYTSFEADGASTWEGIVSPRLAGGVTGKQCYQLSNGSIVRSNLNSGSAVTMTIATG